jgi:predicted lipid carrier protein YhbT
VALETERQAGRLAALDADDAFIDASAKKIPSRLRSAAFAIAADLVLVDGRLERLEGRFLRRLASDLHLRPPFSRAVLDVMRMKNRA